MIDEIESAVLSVSECTKILKIGRDSAYQGCLRDIGRRILIPRRALEKLLESIKS